MRSRIAKHVLVDGFDFVLDLEKSRGSVLVDEVTGEQFLDCYNFFASAPLGINPPDLLDDPVFMAELSRAAVNKPANSDLCTAAMATFVETFVRVLGDPALPHLFFVEGGSLAVENALKCAFDWKLQRALQRGHRQDESGLVALHLTNAFHGRSGYSLSLTNTKPVHTAGFPKFDWPRIEAPEVRFPIDANLTQIVASEKHALRQATDVFARHRDRVACFIAEPIQGEGGDNHLRPEFLLAMQDLCRRNDALFVLDEVQTGVGVTGSPWAYQQLGLEPDVVAFGKRLHVCGIMAGRRVDEVPDNVFTVSGRINSTWGGNLVDMVRARRTLEVLEERNLINRAATAGVRFLENLTDLCRRYDGIVRSPRGRGLMVAVEVVNGELRDEVVRRMRTEEHVLLLPCGKSSIRLRPALSITDEELDTILASLDRVLEGIGS